MIKFKFFRTPTRIRTQTDGGLEPPALPLRHRGIIRGYKPST